jgi:hypothetical protein
MPSINQSSLFTNVTSELGLRNLVKRDPSKFSATLFEISDQQSRDKDYEKGLEWIRTYIGSLQAKLNSTVEELNGLYETMLTDTLYKRADTRDSAKVTNGVEFALTDSCMPDKEITPYLKYVRNYQYNPLYGARGVDINNQYQGDENATSSTGRINYEDTGAAHHELGASAFGTLNYLWQWDVDRINASYATSLDQYIGADGILYVSPWKAGTNNTVPNPLINNVTVRADPNLTVIGDVNKVQVNVTALQPNRGVFFPDTETDPTTVDHVLFETFESDSVLNTTNHATDDCKWTQNYTNPFDRSENKMSEYLQWGVAHNRGASGSTSSIHFGDPTHQNYLYEYYVIKDNVEKATVNDYPIPPKPSPILLPNPDTDQPLPDQDYNAQDKSIIQGYDGTPGYAAGLIVGAAPNANNFHYEALSADHFSQVANSDERDNGTLVVNYTNNSTGAVTSKSYTTPGGISAKWRRSTEVGQAVAYSGSDSYYFGNNTGSSYGADPNVLSPVADTYTITMEWHGEGSYYYVDVLGIPSLITEYEPDFDLHVYNEAGAELGGTVRNTPQHYEDNHTLSSFSDELTNDGTEIHTLSGPMGKRFVKIELRDTDGWLAPIQTYHVGAKLTPVGRNAGGVVSMTNNGEVPMVVLTIGWDWEDSWVPHPETSNRDWWGNGYYGGDAGYTVGNDRVVSNSGGVSGFQIDYYNPYRPMGDMSRRVDLTKMSNNAGTDINNELYNGFERVELRYKQNFITETQDLSMDKKIIQESTNAGASWNDVMVDMRSNSGLLGAPLDGLETLSNGQVWQSKKVSLDASKNWGGEDKQINFQFQAVDQYWNETKGWNVDNVEVVARGQSKGELISPTMDLSKYTTATLKYDSRFGTGQSTGAGVTKPATANDDTTKDPADIAEVYYSIDGGITWKLLLSRLGREVDKSGNIVNAQGSANDAGWVSNEIDLTCAAGQTDVRVKYVFTTNADNNEGDGWNIDNVDVFGKKSASTDFYLYKQNLDTSFVTASYTDVTILGSASAGDSSLNLSGTNQAQAGDYLFINGQSVYVTGASNTGGHTNVTFQPTLLSSVTNGTVVERRRPTNSSENVNTNRPNISFDPLGSNTMGKYTVDNGRVSITNTDTPTFSNTFLTYVEQNTGSYNSKKTDSTAVWVGQDTGPLLVVNKYGAITYTKDTNFTPDSLGRLFNSNGDMYIDEALAMNLGLSHNNVPTMTQIGSKTTGWVNFDVADDGLKFFEGTCFDEDDIADSDTIADSYQHMTVYAKNTYFSNGAGTGNITIDADDNALFYVNGVRQIPSSITPNTSPNTGSTFVFQNFPLADGVNTIAIQQTEVTGPNEHIKVVSSSMTTNGSPPNPFAISDKWAVQLYTGGYKVKPTAEGVGTVATVGGSATVNGTGTAFTSTFVPGSTIVINGKSRTIKQIISDTQLTVTNAWDPADDYTSTKYNVADVPSELGYNAALTGAVAITSGTNIVKGTGTLFTEDFRVGSTITVGSETRTITALGYPLTGTATVSAPNLTKVVGSVTGTPPAAVTDLTNFAADFKAGDPITINGETRIVKEVDPFLSGVAKVDAGGTEVRGSNGTNFVGDYAIGDPITIGSETRYVSAIDPLLGTAANTASVAAGDAIVTGTGFLTFFQPGDKITINGETRTIKYLGTKLGGSVTVESPVNPADVVPPPAGNAAVDLKIVTGTGTHFTSDYAVGDKITIGGETRIISSISSDTTLTVQSAFTAHDHEAYSKNADTTLETTEAFNTAHSGNRFSRDPQSTLTVYSAFSNAHAGNYSRDPKRYLTTVTAFSAASNASYSNPDRGLTVSGNWSATKTGSGYSGIQNDLLDSDVKEVFGEEIKEKKAVQVLFNNIDKTGAGVLSHIMSVEVVATGEPTIQSYDTKEYSTKKQTDTGILITRLDHGFKGGVAQDGTTKEAFNFSPNPDLGYVSDTSGKANITVLMNNSQALTNDATLLIKINYTEDTNMDGIIDDTEAANIKTKYIGQEDGRDTTYYEGTGTVSNSANNTLITGTGTYFTDNYKVGQEFKVKSVDTGVIETKTIAGLGKPLSGTVVAGPLADPTKLTGSGTAFLANFAVGDTIMIGNEKRTITQVNSNSVIHIDAPFINAPSGAAFTKNPDQYMTVTSPFSAAHDADDTYFVTPMSKLPSTNILDRFAYSNSSGTLKSANNDAYANQVFNNMLSASKGRTGGSTVEGNENLFTKRIKQILDGESFQEMLKYGLLDNIFIAATVSDNRGDQIVGKLILDWDWRRRRVNVSQGSFSAVFKA